MPEINNQKKLTPTISSTRTDHFSIRFLLVAPTACYPGLKFVKQTHPDTIPSFSPKLLQPTATDEFHAGHPDVMSHGCCHLPAFVSEQRGDRIRCAEGSTWVHVATGR